MYVYCILYFILVICMCYIVVIVISYINMYYIVRTDYDILQKVPLTWVSQKFQNFFKFLKYVVAICNTWVFVPYKVNFGALKFVTFW